MTCEKVDRVGTAALLFILGFMWTLAFLCDFRADFMRHVVIAHAMTLFSMPLINAAGWKARD